MKQKLENGLSVGELIESLQDDCAHCTITVLPNHGFRVFIGWFGGIQYYTMLQGDELIDLLMTAITKVSSFLAGDCTGWKQDKED